MNNELRRVDATRRAGRFARVYAAIAATRVARFISRYLNWKLDPLLLRLTGGRLATTQPQRPERPAHCFDPGQCHASEVSSDAERAALGTQTQYASSSALADWLPIQR